MTYEILEITQPCNDRTFIRSVNTMEELHKVLTELTDGKYVMLNYFIGDKTLHYYAKELNREFEVFTED